MQERSPRYRFGLRRMANDCGREIAVHHFGSVQMAKEHGHSIPMLAQRPCLRRRLPVRLRKRDRLLDAQCAVFGALGRVLRPALHAVQ